VEALLVTPSFFGYELSIAEEMRRRGARVTVLDERPRNSSWVKAVARLAPALLGPLVRRHYRRAARDLRSRRLSLVLVVKAEVVPVWFLEQLRRDHPGCVLSFYAFDSFANSPRGESLLPLFDHAFSFDRNDVARLPGLRYKPLFHTRDFAGGSPIASRAHDLAFVGTVHSDRFAVCALLAAAADSTDYFFYSPARWHHALTWLRDANIRTIPWAAVSFEKRSRREVATAFASARAVIDVQRSGQSGLTMRTFEVLASGAKLITSNASIRLEPFFDPAWVLVLPEQRNLWDLDAVRRFLSGPGAPPPDLMQPWSLAAWVDDFLELTVSTSSADVP